jgi:penicillin-insensitive murein endopeptidase
MLTDGTSVSIGHHSRGALRQAAALPFRGEGYVVPELWRKRGRNYGTDELVALLMRASRKVSRQYRNSTLGVADMSERSGGPALPHHRSHHSGRDVDLIFYSTDTQGYPMPPQEMLSFNRGGVSRPSKQRSTRLVAAHRLRRPLIGFAAETPLEGPKAHRFDLVRNWALIKALVTDPQVPVQWIFIGRHVARLLIDHARRTAEPTYLINHVASLMHQPGDASSHNDHMHVRIYCDAADRMLGCRDRGPERWMKKTLKYVELPLRLPTLPRLPRVTMTPARFKWL